MSIKEASHWLYSHHPAQKKIDARSNHQVISNQEGRLLFGAAKSVSVISGKGGVGKTSFSLKLSRILAQEGYKVLLIDCDTNLANTAVKLGLPLNQGFYQLITAQKEFDEVIYKNGQFHLLSACNGSLDLFEEKLDWGKVVVDIICAHERNYDFIFLDCPAGLSKKALSISAYCDYRFVVVTPDKSSITDSYSLMKILNQCYKVQENHLILNKISDKQQYIRIVKTLSSVVENFLSARLNILGAISFFDGAVDQFDRELEKFSKSKIHNQFSNVIKKFTEESIGNVVSGTMPDRSAFARNVKQNDRTTF